MSVIYFILSKWEKQKTGWFYSWLLFIFLSLLSSAFAQKQSKNELENKNNAIQKEIEYTNKLLSETKNNKKISLNQLVTLNKKISAREELIALIYNEINLFV